MLTNPGGRLAIADIVGRDIEICRYWNVLGRQSLVLTAERRIGKTHILAKMDALPREGFLTFYQELEGIHRILELVRSIHSYPGAGQHRYESEELLAGIVDCDTASKDWRFGAAPGGKELEVTSLDGYY